MRLVSQREGMEAFHLHCEGARHQRVSATGRSRTAGVRRVPYPEGEGHAFQDQVRALHGLSQRSSRSPVRRGAILQRVRPLPQSRGIQAFDLHSGQA